MLQTCKPCGRHIDARVDSCIGRHKKYRPAMLAPSPRGSWPPAAARCLGETGPLSQRVQKGRQALRILHMHSVEVHVWRCIGRGPGVQVNPLNPLSASPCSVRWSGDILASIHGRWPAGTWHHTPNISRGRRGQMAPTRRHGLPITTGRVCGSPGGDGRRRRAGTLAGRAAAALPALRAMQTGRASACARQ